MAVSAGCRRGKVNPPLWERAPVMMRYASQGRSIRVFVKEAVWVAGGLGGRPEERPQGCFMRQAARQRRPLPEPATNVGNRRIPTEIRRRQQLSLVQTLEPRQRVDCGPHRLEGLVFPVPVGQRGALVPGEDLLDAVGAA